MPKTASTMVEIPRSTGDTLVDSRGVNIARAWYPNVHMHFFCDFSGDDGIKVRLAMFKSSGLDSIVNVTVRSGAATSLVVPEKVEFINVTREPSDDRSNKAPCTARVDMWE